ncbi:MAG: MBL fold metallo-hydrolase [Tunicatimonas sp.]
MKNPFPVPISDATPIFRVASDVVGLQVVMVNVYFISQNHGGETVWYLVDAGLGECADRIIKAAELTFVPGATPTGILLTHGHFDHIGALNKLAHHWNVPVYAHPLEIPYLTGQSAYPPPDPTVGGGSLAALAALYPKQPITLDQPPLPYSADGHIPGLEDWRVIDTPGHTPGHVSFFRESDKTLVVGDAFITVKQESLRAVLQQRSEVHGPPAYFTCDWSAAQQSVATLTALQPEVAACGHGKPMRGVELQSQLTYLNTHFSTVAIPSRGRYVGHPARANESGVISVPPARIPSVMQGALAGLALAGAAWLAYTRKQRK